MEMSSEKQQLPKPKRRWFQLRLRTLLALVTLASVPLSWVGWELDQRRREKVVIAWVEEMGGRVSFEAKINSGFKTNWWKTATDTLFGKRVHSFILGDEVTDLSPLAGLKNLNELSFSETEVSDLTPLADMKNLKYLDFCLTEVSDLSPLAGLKNLQCLSLYSTPVSDLTPLSELKNLKVLDLRHTEVSDLTLLAGLENLEQLSLNQTEVSDLSPLASLQNLKLLYLQKIEVSDLSPLAQLKNLWELNLIGTKVTEEQIDKLKLALPNCKISR